MKKQTKLFQFAPEKTRHGGALGIGKRKVARPFVRKKIIHIVLRSSKAKGALSMLRPHHAKSIHTIIHKQSKKHFVKLCEYVNVGNHLHIKVKAYEQDYFKAYLKSLTAMIARKVTGAARGRTFGKFWDGLAFTRILATSFEEKYLAKYFNANAMEVKFGKEIREIFLGQVKFEYG